MGPRPIGWVSSKEEEIWTKKQTQSEDRVKTQGDGSRV